MSIENSRSGPLDVCAVFKDDVRQKIFLKHGFPADNFTFGAENENGRDRI